MNILSNKIYIGTSGYKHTSWQGNVYPEKLKPINYLPYYINELKLNFLEITFTFHKMPYKKTFDQIFDHIKNKLLNFRLSIKLHKSLLRTKLDSSILNEFIQSLETFSKTQIPLIFLADYSTKFGVNKENLHAIIQLKKALEEHTLFISLPHRSWYKERYINIFRANKIGLVIHYIPESKNNYTPFLITSTNDYAYFRFYSNPSFHLSSSNINISYNYSPKELINIAKIISKTSIISKETYVAFCNVKNGIAAFNAVLLKKIMEESTGE
jgi:uncharacterized protein YecE (DUF72 family)